MPRGKANTYLEFSEFLQFFMPSLLIPNLFNKFTDIFSMPITLFTGWYAPNIINNFLSLCPGLEVLKILHNLLMVQVIYGTCSLASLSTQSNDGR